MNNHLPMANVFWGHDMLPPQDEGWAVIMEPLETFLLLSLGNIMLSDSNLHIFIFMG